MKLSNIEMASFLMYRTINPMHMDTLKKYFPNRLPITNSQELESHLKQRIQHLSNKKIALALSGGIDSAILAKFMPRGSVAYTFQCIVPGVEVTNEVPMAKKYAEECGLSHKVVEIYWEDFEKYSPILMKHKKAPIHSIEVQIYKAALQAKQDGIDILLFGESADVIYGGLSGLLSKDWKIGDFIERYSYLLPYLVMKNPVMPIEIYQAFNKDGYVDPHKFVSNFFIQEGLESYLNATQTAGINIITPYAETYLATTIDYNRIRNGENKYLVREIFKRLYPNFSIPPKTPMPRPMNEWLKNYDGPNHPEFYAHCGCGLTGDQKWLLWCLEKYLNL